MSMLHASLAASIPAAFLLGACALPVNSGQALTPMTSSAPQATVPGEDPSAEAAAMAADDLALRLGLPQTEIDVQVVEPTEWPDASLGCPLPDVAYAQVVTPGYRVLLIAAGSVYEFHTDLAGHVVLCQDGAPVLPDFPADPGEIDDGIPWLPVGTPPGDPMPQ